MKRFFCVKCKKVKRVRKWPLLLENQQSEDVNLRLGECNHHSQGYALVHPELTARSSFNRPDRKVAR